MACALPSSRIWNVTVRTSRPRLGSLRFGKPHVSRFRAT